MSSADALQRILDPEGLYWHYPGEQEDYVDRARVVEIRLDVPIEGVAAARGLLEPRGWKFASQPDPADDPDQRLYFRRVQTMEPAARTSMLTDGCNAAIASNGQFWSWINLDDESAA